MIGSATAIGFSPPSKPYSHGRGLQIIKTGFRSRHIWGMDARNHHIPISVIAAAMGHNSEKTTLIYLASLENSVIDKANRRVIESVGKAVSP